MLPNFDDVSHVVERFKLGFVYQQCCPCPTTPLPATDSPPDPVDSEPQRSSRVTRPSDRYGFPHTSLTTTLDTIVVPHSYSQASFQACWQRAMQEEL